MKEQRICLYSIEGNEGRNVSATVEEVHIMAWMQNFPLVRLVTYLKDSITLLLMLRPLALLL